MSAIFGGSKSSQSSSNQAYPYLQSQYSGQVGTGTGANSLLSSLLGVSGSSDAGQQGLQNFANSAGQQFTLDQGSKAITGNSAARGLLQSGATGKALTQFGQDNAQQYYNQYLQNLLGLSNQGLQAGSLISGAGQTSSSKSSSKPGLGGFIGSLASAIPSDPRLKTDVTKIGKTENGLGVYEYRYKWEKLGTVHRGYMADEVAAISPEALGPEIDGFMTVDYTRLPSIRK